MNLKQIRREQVNASVCVKLAGGQSPQMGSCRALVGNLYSKGLTEGVRS